MHIRHPSNDLITLVAGLLVLAVAFVILASIGARAQAGAAEWREHEGVVTAYLNEAQYEQWQATKRVPLVNGRVCNGGRFVGYGRPSAGEEGVTVYLVDCGDVPGITSPPQTQAATRGCQEVNRINQLAGPNVEASIIHVMNCPAGEIFIYEYVNRPGFRVIRPPEWGLAIGGRDVGSMAEAVRIANGAQPPPQSSQPPVQPQPPPVQTMPAGGVQPQFLEPIILGPPDAQGGCHGEAGYYNTQVVAKGPWVCMKCPEHSDSGWYGDRKYCVRCPSGMHYDGSRICIPGAG